MKKTIGLLSLLGCSIFLFGVAHATNTIKPSASQRVVTASLPHGDKASSVHPAQPCMVPIIKVGDSAEAVKNICGMPFEVKSIVTSKLDISVVTYKFHWNGGDVTTVATFSEGAVTKIETIYSQ